ncbi:MAG: GNAT family N-acetyltransferase [Filimonas sp.]|nr:GNAT family N-acetyltransferase [Filimonas sp.]
MSAGITIRQLTNEYCKQITDLILHIQQVEFNVPIKLEDQPDLLDIETNYLQDGGGFWGAFHNGELVGTIALLHIGQHAGAIRKMFVKQAFRGKELGIAQQLFDTLLEDCKHKAITDVYLGTVDILKAAHRFYERNGFVREPKESLPSYFPFMRPDTVFYHLVVNKS